MAPGKTIWKSIGAVLAGFVANAVTTTVIDIFLHIFKVFPPWDQPLNDGQSLMAFSYRVILGIGGCYLTARLAPSRPLAHAMAQGFMGALLCIVAVLATWDKNLGPHWYPIALAVIALPCAWVGALFYERRK